MGAGHTSAGKALLEAVEAMGGGRGRIVDSYRYAASVVSQVVSSGYIGMVKTVPQLYRYLYDRAERATSIGPFRAWAQQFTAANLRPLMEAYRPDVVVCTHAFPCGAMAEYKRVYADAPPLVGVVTDFAVHGFWVHDVVDLYGVATEELRGALIDRGIAPHCIEVSGIPVRAAFGQASLPRTLLRDRLGLPQDRAIVLLMGGGLGIGPLQTMMNALAAVNLPICVVAMLGRNARMAARVHEYARHVPYPVREIGFVENVEEYMHAADVLVSKPGGLTCAEALCAQLPVVLFKPLPGQEERNTRCLTEHGAAVRARTASEIAPHVEALLRVPESREAMRAAMATLRRPHASQTLARRLMEVAG